MTHIERLLGALYVSEGWYTTWQNRMKCGTSIPYYKARALVVYDRLLNGQENRK